MHLHSCFFSLLFPSTSFVTMLSSFFVSSKDWKPRERGLHNHRLHQAELLQPPNWNHFQYSNSLEMLKCCFRWVTTESVKVFTVQYSLFSDTHYCIFVSDKLMTLLFMKTMLEIEYINSNNGACFGVFTKTLVLK